MGLFKTTILVLTLASFNLAGTASASLGDKESTIDKDLANLRGTRKMIAHSSYRVHEITDQQQVVREYVGSNGIVFAVTWRGQGQPDLGVLFGSYYREFQTAENSSAHSIGRAPRQITSQNIVAEKSGHMGDVRGRAYVPNLLPSDFDLKKLQ
jgi:hypothetical protein